MRPASRRRLLTTGLALAVCGTLSGCCGVGTTVLVDERIPHQVAVESKVTVWGKTADGRMRQTTAAGIISIITGITTAVSQYLSGGLAAVQGEILISTVVAGFGLLMAKDASVSNAPNPGEAKSVPAPMPPPAA